MIFIIIGLVLSAIAAVLLIMYKKKQDQLLEVKFQKAQAVGDILGLHSEVASEIGTGGFRQIVETNGIVTADEPVVAELSGRECAHYTMQVEERYEEQYWEQDSEGREHQRTRTGTNTVASNTRSARFYVQDGDSRILIDPDNAKLDLEKVVDRFEPAHGGLSRISFGGFSLDLGSGMREGRRITGYNYTESILPLDSRVYVIGEACDTRGELVIACPEDRGKPFIVSLKSEEEVQQSFESSIRWMKIAAIALFVAGDVLLVIGAVRLISN